MTETLDTVPAQVEASTPSMSGEPSPASRLGAGARIGRYVIRSELGRGSTGAVYVARDALLDRAVALKVIHTRGSASRQRALLDEARALAQVKHPHVATVYEVGTDASGVTFICMELIEGESLRAWLRSAPRSTLELRRVLREAGEGLLAVHERRLIHGDFKPDNVMVDARGRAVVLDFGLAHVARADGRGRRQGGTPGYMAPELVERRAPASARADQFGFCVAAWEALFGRRPFDDGDLGDWTPRRPAGSRSVPRALLRALERGLEVEPERRFDSLQPLLDALARERPVARWVALGLTVAAVGVGLGLAPEDDGRVDALVACNVEGQAIARLWTPGVREAIAGGFAATELSFAARSWARSSALLDAWTADWARLRTELCVGYRLDGSWTASAHASALECFATREAELRALLEVYAEVEVDETLVPSAVAITSRLSDPARCVDRRRLAHQLAPAEPDERARVQDLRTRTLRATMLTKAGRSEAARIEALAALDEAEAVGWAPARAEALHVLASTYHDTGEHERARELHEEAFFLASATGHDELAARAANSILGLLSQQADLEHVDYWERSSAAAIARAGLEGQEEEAVRLFNLANLDSDRGRYEQARARIERSVEIWAQTIGLEHPTVAVVYNNLGAVLRALEREDEAAATFERAYALLDEIYGPDHPSVCSVLINLGNSYSKRGEFERALEFLRRAESALTRAYGPNDHRVTTALHNQATTLRKLGEAEEARAVQLRSLAIREAIDPSHPRVASSLAALAIIEHQLGDFEAALEFATRALELRVAVYGDRHVRVASARHTRGVALRELGRLEDARVELRGALELREELLASDSRFIGVTLHELARVELELGEAGGEPRARLERAMRLTEGTPENYGVRFEFARLDLDAGERDDARARVVALRDELRGLSIREDPGGAQRRRLPELEAWLAGTASE